MSVIALVLRNWVAIAYMTIFFSLVLASVVAAVVTFVRGGRRGKSPS